MKRYFNCNDLRKIGLNVNCCSSCHNDDYDGINERENDDSVLFYCCAFTDVIRDNHPDILFDKLRQLN